MFPVDKVPIPNLPTRRALLAIDLQNDFVLEDGSLPVKQPEGYVDRIVELTKSLRAIRNVDVIWVRSEWERHRPAENEQILATNVISRAPIRATPRGRTRTSAPHNEQAMEGDDEAFLSAAPQGKKKPVCVRRGQEGSALAAQIQEVAKRDQTLTKTHYSAFHGGQLLQLLRVRFVTELYICGALTNVSIYATALDAAKHGYDITILEDCCGYRSELRHSGAIEKLIQLTGCEIMDADALLEVLKPMPTKKSSNDDSRRRSDGGAVRGTSSTSPQHPAVGDPAPMEEKVSAATLVARLGKLKLSGASLSADGPVADTTQPHKIAPHSQQVQPVLGKDLGEGGGKSDVSKNGGRVDPLGKDADVQPQPHQSDGGGDSPISKDSVGTGPKTVDTPGASHEKATTGPDRPKSKGMASESTSSEKSEREPNDKKQHTADKPTHDTLNSKDGQEVSNSNKSSSEEAATNNMADTDKPTLSSPICEGDTTIIHNVLPVPLASTAFERLIAEVAWQRMSHQGGEVPRLVAVQGSVEADGTMPVYRHPSDESPPLLPFSLTVLEIKTDVEKLLGHPLNHVLIQFYRDGSDYISEHSDKTLDITPGSFIANVSLGAERTMVFRTKRLDKDPSRKASGDAGILTPAVKDGDGADEDSLKRRVTRAALPHNSLCRMGLTTNMRWLHSIRQDKRLDRDKTPAELAFGAARISLTFRRIGTFLSADSDIIWGQGATAKAKSNARPVVNGQTPEAVRMLQAFGTENHSSEFDWAKHYGRGFDVLHMSIAPRLFAGPDALANVRCALMLAECGVLFAKGNLGVATATDAQTSDVVKSNGRNTDDESPLLEPPVLVKFVDNDAARSVVQGDMAILLYLDAVHGVGKELARLDLAKKFSRFHLAVALGERWRAARKLLHDNSDANRNTVLLKQLKPDLVVWEGFAADGAESTLKRAGSSSSSSTPAEGNDASGEAAGKGHQNEESEAKHIDRELSVFIAGGTVPCITDVALWPVLHEMQAVCGPEFLRGCPHLGRYYSTIAGRESVRKVFAEKA